MAVLQSVWIVIAVSIFQLSQAFYPIRAPPCLPGFPPRHDSACSSSSCRESIEDLKALLEITQALQPNQSYTCPSCSSTFSEEIILKLVNALIYSATQNCGSCNVGGGGGHVIGGGNTGPVGGSGNSGGISSHGHGRGPISGPNQGSNGDGLIQVGLLDGQDTAHVDLAGKKILGVDLGPQPGSGNGRGVPTSGGNSGMRPNSWNHPNGGSNDDGLIQVGLLDGQDTAHVDLAGKKILGVDLGPQPGSGNGRGVPTSGGNSGMRPNSWNHPNGGSNDDGLIQVGLLDGQDTAHVDLAGKKILGVDLGPQIGSRGSAGGSHGGGGGGSDDGLINLGVLAGGNDLLNVGLGGTKVLGVDLGPPPSGGTGGNTGNPGGNKPSGTGNPGTISQPSQSNYGNTIDYSPNTVPIANSNANTVTTPVNVETIVYNGGGSQVPAGPSSGGTGGSTGKPSGNSGNPGGNTGNPGGNTGNPGGNTGSPGGNTGNPGGNKPSGTGSPGTISQPSQPNYGNTIDYSPNTVPIANSNANTVTTPVNVETIVYNASQVPGNTGKMTDGDYGFEDMAKPVIGD